MRRRELLQGAAAVAAYAALPDLAEAIPVYPSDGVVSLPIPPISQIELIGTQIGSADVVFNNSANLIAQSQSFGAWSLTRATATPIGAGAASPIQAPDGTYSAFGVTETFSASSHEITWKLTKAASAIQYTVYVDVKPDLRSRVALNAYANGGTIGIFAVFDLVGVQVGVAATTFGSGFSGGLAGTPTALANGFVRCPLTFTSNTATSLNIGVQSDNGSGTAPISNSFTGNPAQIAFYISGSQLQLGASALAYVAVPTNGAKVVDGDFTTYMQSPNSQEWVGVDLGASNTAVITGWKFAPQPSDPGSNTDAIYDYEVRMVGAQVQVSSDPTFASGVTTLDTVPSFPWYPRFQYNQRPVLANAAHRAVRVQMSGLSGGPAEVRFFGKYGSTLAAKPMPPAISPCGGRFPAGTTTVTITSPTLAAQIYYTTDGSTPTNGSTLYSGPFLLTIGASALTLKAIAYDATLNTPTSDVMSGIFNPWGFKPNENVYDDTGILIEGHSAWIPTIVNGRYYWFGDFTNRQNPAGSNDIRTSNGAWLYSSPTTGPDALYRWTFEGEVIDNPPGYDAMVRKKVLYNALNNNYVMWSRAYTIFGALGPGVVATAPTIKGPWTWVNVNVNPGAAGFEDYDLFMDDDGVTAYCVWNTGAFLRVGQLAADYQSITGTITNIPGTTGEGLALFKRGGTYFLNFGNQIYYNSAVSYNNRYIINTGASPLAAWPNTSTAIASFAVDPVGGNFNGQCSSVQKIPGKTDGYMWRSDFWNVTSLYASRFVFLPITFADATHMQVQIPASWDWNTTFA